MIQKVKKNRRIPLPEKVEQIIKGKKEIYSRKIKYKKDWRLLEDAEIEYEENN